MRGHGPFFLALITIFQTTWAFALLSPSRGLVPRLSSPRVSIHGKQSLKMVATAEPTIKDVYTLLVDLSTRVDKLEKENAMLKASAGTATLTELTKITKQACDILQPMIQKFYDKINAPQPGDSATTKKKADSSYFTIVDGVVQHLIINYLFKGNKFAEIVGEEDGSDINIVQRPFHVDELIVPEEFESIISEAREAMSQLAKRIDYFSYKSLTVFVDPIDGTREFATGKGEACRCAHKRFEFRRLLLSSHLISSLSLALPTHRPPQYVNRLQRSIRKARCWDHVPPNRQHQGA